MLNILLITVLTWLLAALLSGAQLSSGAIGIVIGTAVLVIVLRHYLGVLAAISSERASHAVKQQLREKIYRKLLSLGGSYHERVSTSEIVQVSVEGVDQLETYFSSYLPQFFLQHAGTGHAVRVIGVRELESGGGAVRLCATDTDIDRCGADICKKAAVQILGAVHLARRSFSGKPAGTDDTEDLSGG